MSAVSGDGVPATGGDAVPVCPRHPTREAYVRCQRCERPVCPECQRPAAVGVQCVDCVRDGAKSVRTARTALGGRPGDGRPLVSMTLIGVNAVVFALQLLLGSAFAHRFDFYPPNALIEPWRFVTSAFLHSQSLPIHILFNMYALWMVGQYLEPILGRTRFLALYVISALGGSAGYFLVVNPLSDGWRTGALGASGAVFGLFAAYLVVNRRLGRDSRGMVVLLVINAAFGFFPGIAWQAHVGGFVTGLLVTAVLAYTPRERRTALQPLALAAVVVLLAALVLLKASTVPAALLAAG